MAVHPTAVIRFVVRERAVGQNQLTVFAVGSAATAVVLDLQSLVAIKHAIDKVDGAGVISQATTGVGKIA